MTHLPQQLEFESLCDGSNVRRIGYSVVQSSGATTIMSPCGVESKDLLGGDKVNRLQGSVLPRKEPRSSSTKVRDD